MRDFVNLCLLKAENPEAYKKLASTGTMVGFPATVAGNTHRPDIGTKYHSTIKFFNSETDHPREIHQIASGLDMHPPDPHTTGIKPTMFQDRLGNDVYVLTLHGEHADKISEHNAAFSNMGFKTSYKHTPHVSVDKATWEKIKNSGAKTCHDAGISFGHAELVQGDKPLQHYGPKETKLAASEDYGDDLNKGAIKNFAIGLAAAGSLAMIHPKNTAQSPVDQSPKAGSHEIEHTKPASPKYDRKEMIRTIAAVESNHGTMLEHETTPSGERAFGKYGLMPNTIQETIKLNKDLRQKYGKAAKLSGDDLHRFMKDNPGLEDQIAEKHVARLEHHFGQNPTAIGYGWLNGISGTYKAQKANKDIESHWHVKKILDNYGQPPQRLKTVARN